MMDEQAVAIQQLAIWQDKYNRLAEQHASLLAQNQDLEDRLINVVDKIERDKSLLSDEIDHLAERLACATNTIDYMKNECARYKSDCMLAVHLLQCQPSFYTSQHLNSLPAELRQKLCPETTAANDGAMGSRLAANEKKIVHFSTSAMTFPPTAVFLQANEPSSMDEAPPDEPDSRHDMRDVFVKKIMLAPEYQTEKLAQCPKCGFAVVKYDRCTQTVGEYLCNSRSAPHLHSMDDEAEVDDEKQRRTRRSIGRDLLIDLSDDDHASSPTSPAFYSSDGGIVTGQSTAAQPQVRFNVSPGVHHHHQHHQQQQQHPNIDSSGGAQQPDSILRQKGGSTGGTPSKKQDFTTIPISNDDR